MTFILAYSKAQSRIHQRLFEAGLVDVVAHDPNDSILNPGPNQHTHLLEQSEVTYVDDCVHVLTHPDPFILVQHISVALTVIPEELLAIGLILKFGWNMTTIMLDLRGRNS